MLVVLCVVTLRLWLILKLRCICIPQLLEVWGGCGVEGRARNLPTRAAPNPTFSALQVVRPGSTFRGTSLYPKQ